MSQTIEMPKTRAKCEPICIRVGLFGKVLVTGGGGFIGGHLVRRLVESGCEVRTVDIKPKLDWWQRFRDAEEIVVDLCDKAACMAVCDGVDVVVNLACDMGGIGFIELNKAACMQSVLINTNLLKAARHHGVGRYFYSSSACVYRADAQDKPGMPPLKESDAYPAAPEQGYGHEKLFSEQMCQLYHEDYGLETRIARFHNVMGPHGSWCDGREKAPAAICRKVAEAVLSGKHVIDIWGDGTRTRSFCWIDDCIEGILRLTASDCVKPLNLGSTELVTINELVSMVEEIGRVKLTRQYDTSKPQGVFGRNSDNTALKEALGWEPTTRLHDGLVPTYDWIFQQLAKKMGAKR